MNDENTSNSEYPFIKVQSLRIDDLYNFLSEECGGSSKEEIKELLKEKYPERFL